MFPDPKRNCAPGPNFGKRTEKSSEPIDGFYKAAKLMVMIMFVGGAVEILEKTGAIHAAFGKLASKQNLNVNVLVFLVMAFMSIGGAAGVFANPVVALIPIGIILATNLGYDSFTGFLLVYMGAYSGFNVGWANASTIGTAQPIAFAPSFPAPMLSDALMPAS